MPSDVLDRLGFETMLAELSTRFVHLVGTEVDREIEDALGRVCQLLQIDFAVLWQWFDAEPDVIVPTHVYSALAASPRPDPMSQEHYPWIVRQMRAGQRVAVCSLEELPAEAAADRENARITGIKSNLTLPLSVGDGPPIGALAFNTVEAEREWPDDVVQRLELVGQVFTHALDRSRHERRLQENKERLAAGADLAGLGFYSGGYPEGKLSLDDRLLELCGFPPERREPPYDLEFWMQHLHPDDRQRVLYARQQLHDGRKDRFSIEYRYLHPDRGEIWIQHLAGVAARDDDRLAVRTFGVLRDITERKRAEDELSDLSRRLIGAHEEQRALLARELHDDLTQRVAVLAIEAGRAELTASDASQERAMRSVREGLVRLSEDIHSLAYQLHPSVLAELGLAEALRAECERQGRRGQIEFSLDLDPLPAVLGREVALCLFRIAQEALNNVSRHSSATTASVTLRQVDHGLLVAIRDDGVGFDPAKPGARRSLGLASMRERARLVNGTLDVESAPDRGTTIVAWVPLEEVPK